MDACAKWSRSVGFGLSRLAKAGRGFRCLGIAIGLLLGLATGLTGGTRLSAADFRTPNFLIMAPSPQLARAVGEAAEAFRRDLAIHWLGAELPPWPNPCPVRVVAGENLAAQGVTTYNRSPVRDFQMEVVGSPERILDSVLPHEVSHTVLATHFGRPLPRWADEGICTTVEHVSERQKHEAKLREFLATRRGISMNKLFLMTEYPQDVLPMYAQGYSVCQFLIAQRGPREFVNFIGAYMQTPSWTLNVRNHYGYESLAELQQLWLQWVAQGSGSVDAFVKAPSLAAGGDVAQFAVASPTRSAAGPGDIALARNGNALTLTPPNQATQGGDAGWYGRFKPRGGTAATPSTAATPPSLATAGPQATPQFRPLPPTPAGTLYSAAQPQPEQGSVGISGGGPMIATEAWTAVPSPPAPAPGTPAPQAAPSAANPSTPDLFSIAQSAPVAPGSAASNPAASGPVAPNLARATPIGEPVGRSPSSPSVQYGEGGSSRGDYRPGSVASPGHYLR
jgi:hypothetical protein